MLLMGEAKRGGKPFARARSPHNHLSTMQRHGSFALLLMVTLCSSAFCQRKVFYDVSEKPVHWHAAQQYCREHFTDLASVSSREEEEQIRSMIEPHERRWIGLYRDAADWKGWKWSGGGRLTPDPRVPFIGEVCVFIKSAIKTWYASSCNKQLHFICYRWEGQLILVKQNKTWEEALGYCRARYRDLASVLSESDHLQARGALKEAQTDEVWTGLRFLAGYWLWVNGDAMGDGGESKSRVQLPGCPGNQHCGTLGRMGESWANRECQEKRNFLCCK